MKRRIPLILFLIVVAAGIIAGYAWRNYPAGILLGLGIGIISMVVARFILSSGRESKEPPAAAGQEH
ncbi:MAG: hypothetical protein JST18_02040 [Bacteroidetes bacterium]|nr:hypothetical protein [Bacteroidota bacterium]